MENVQQAFPSLSPVEAEEFWTGGSDALRPAPAAAGTPETPAGKGTASVVPPLAIRLDARVLRFIRDDHQNADPHQPNLCPICLILAASLGEPQPIGRWAEPAERALVYARTLYLLGQISAQVLLGVTVAAERAQGGEIDTGWHAAQWAPVHLLGLAEGPPEERFDRRAYRAIRAAVHAGDAVGAAAGACCAGVDLPGVGHVHGPECLKFGSPVSSGAPSPGNAPPVRSGRPYVAGEVPLPLRDLVDGGVLEGAARREELLGQLVFAARDLAQSRMSALGCHECHRLNAHHHTCRTARVLGILSELVATLDSNLYGKEAAGDGETDGAGEGIRPRGLREGPELGDRTDEYESRIDASRQSGGGR